MIHGDVKPLNIMIDGFGATRLVDWGVAKVASPTVDGPREARPPGRRPGTPTFISSLDTPATFASDIYALGQTLMWILAERSGNGAGSGRPADDTPAPLWAIAQKATSDEHGARYGSAAELAQDVQDVLEDKPIAAYRDGWPTRLRRRCSRHRTVVALILVVLLLAAVIGPLAVRP